MYYLAYIKINRRYLDREDLTRLVKAKDRNTAYDKIDFWLKHTYLSDSVMNEDVDTEVKIEETIE